MARNTVSTWWESNGTTNVSADNGCTPRPDARVKIPAEQKPIILERVEAGETQKQIAADYGVTQQAVAKVAAEEAEKRNAPKPAGPPADFISKSVVDWLEMVRMKIDGIRSQFGGLEEAMKQEGWDHSHDNYIFNMLESLPSTIEQLRKEFSRGKKKK